MVANNVSNDLSAVKNVTTSGKKKAHTSKVQVVVSKRSDNQGKTRTKIQAVSESYEGSQHDKKVYQQARMISARELPRFADSGYQATGINVPHKKPPKGKLTPEQKAHNRVLSKERACVEHGIGKLKIWQILSVAFP